MLRISVRFAGLLLLLAGLVPSGARAQDVVELGRVHGTRPPEAYFRLMERNPRAFTFSRAWLARNPRLRLIEGGDGPPEVELRQRETGGAAVQGAGTGGPSGILGRRDGPVEGDFRFPVVMGYFADTAEPPPFTAAQVQTEFFDGPNSRGQTITQYYAEISGGRVQLRGEVFPWAQSTLTQLEVSGGIGGFGPPARVGEFIDDLLAEADDGSVDWGAYDNDGPDGVPNSGDDDGFVDLLVVFHPTPGAECNGNYQRIWSHKWTISSWGGGAYATSTPAAGGGVIRIDDYTIEPVYDCAGQKLNEIGVFAHELGHGFGLPDLYCTLSQCDHNGIGEWGLMGGGAWGCRGDDAARPCHMSAWSKSVLGWLDVETLPAGQDLGVRTLEPVESSGRAFRVDAQDGSGEYYLLEHRERLGSDQNLYAPGLLVWHIDPQWIEQHWASNAVNNDPDHLGVWLRQADGRNDIATSKDNRGDSGDPFPGVTGAMAFHAGSDPAALTHVGNASGLTLLDIARTPSQVSFHALTRFQTLTFRTEGETTGGLLAVDGTGLPGTVATVPSAPFETHELSAAAGAPLTPGRRRAFVEWTDDPELPRERTVTTGLQDAEFVARYGPLQVHLDLAVAGGEFGVAPGTVTMDPASTDSWYAEGSLVTVQAEATPGFEFVAWAGDLAGKPNPTMVTLDDPEQGVASFRLTYALPAEVSLPLEAAADPQVELTPPEGTAPFTWQVVAGPFPDGLSLTTDGRLLGAPMAEGDFPVEIRVTDARGLQAQGRVLLQVSAPDLSLSQLGGQLLGTRSSLTGLQLQFLDRVGNDDGSYDVGDLRIFLRAHAVEKNATVPARGAFAIPWARVSEGGGP